MQFADRTFGALPSRLRTDAAPGSIAVRIGVSHHRRCQRPLALLSVRNESGRHGRDEADQEGNDHRASGRAVSQIATAPAKQQQVSEIYQGLQGPADEVAETCMARADKAL